MPRGETSNIADGLENVVAAETVLSKVDGDAGVLILRGHYLQDIPRVSGNPNESLAKA